MRPGSRTRHKLGRARPITELPMRHEPIQRHRAPEARNRWQAISALIFEAIRRRVPRNVVAVAAGKPLVAAALLRLLLTMIARRWHGRVPGEQAAEYLQLMARSACPTIARPAATAAPGACSAATMGSSMSRCSPCGTISRRSGALPGTISTKAKYYDFDPDFCSSWSRRSSISRSSKAEAFRSIAVEGAARL